MSIPGLEPPWPPADPPPPPWRIGCVVPPLVGVLGLALIWVNLDGFVLFPDYRFDLCNGRPAPCFAAHGSNALVVFGVFCVGFACIKVAAFLRARRVAARP